MVIAYQGEAKEDVVGLLAELRGRIAALEVMISGRCLVGDCPLPGQTTGEFSQADAQALVDHSWPVTSAPRLTEREVQILQLIGRGYLNKQIAAVLGIRENTVKNHVGEILRKLHASCRTQAVIAGLERGFLSLSYATPLNGRDIESKGGHS